MNREMITVKLKAKVVIKVLATLAFLLVLSFYGTHVAYAVQTNETAGPGSTGGGATIGYGWQQVFTNTTTTTTSRLTGSADRMNYSYGYKNIQIYVREEDYWAEDCGWWYVGAGNTTGVRLVDAKGDIVQKIYGMTPTQGRNITTYSWGTDDDPGRWTVYVNDSVGNLAVFYLYVKGQLNVTSVTSNSTPSSGSPVYIFANISDNAGNSINGSYKDNTGSTIPPTVTLQVSGAGEFFQDITMTDDGLGPDVAVDGNWTGVFTPQNVGDYKVTVKATDGNLYWVENRGSAMVSVTGSFPYASLGLPAILRTFGSMTKSLDLSSFAAALLALLCLAVVRRRNR